jgi:hypothetical protein
MADYPTFLLNNAILNINNLIESLKIAKNPSVTFTRALIFVTRILTHLKTNQNMSNTTLHSYVEKLVQDILDRN